jgi:hypothetical protein
MKRFGLLLIICSLFLVAGCGSDEKEQIPPPNVQEKAFSYEIVRAKSYSSEKFLCEIVVADKISKAELLNLSAKIIDAEYKKAPSTNEFILRFYDHPSYIDVPTYVYKEIHHSPLGEIIYKLNGDSFSVSLDALKEKDWKKQPTPKEAELGNHHLNWIWDKEGDQIALEEEYAKQFLANQKGIDIALIATRVQLWATY